MTTHSDVNAANGASITPGQPAHHDKFPWKHIIGYVLSLILTFAALGLVLSSALPVTVDIVTIVVLAIMQLLVQLLMFMHVTENHGSRTHVMTLLFAFFVAITIVAGSAWIMTFRSSVA